MSITLATLEAIIDQAEVATQLESAMPAGGRPRQLSVRTLLVGVLAAIADDRPAHLTRVHGALVALGHSDQLRLGVIASSGHRLTYRQVERTFNSMVDTMDAGSKTGSDASCEARLVAFADAVLEASIPGECGSTSVAVDWSDHPSWSRPAARGERAADPDAAWGHRKPNTPGARHEAFFGYYAQAVAMVPDEGGPPVPELIRRIALHPCDLDPPTALVPTLQRLVDGGVPLGDVLADSGYAHRIAEHWASPLRRLGAALVQDLHPHDRGPQGTHQGAVACNGNLYCPATPPALFDIGPAPPSASAEQLAVADAVSAEAARYKLGRLHKDDAEGYHRVGCPAVAGKIRCPLKPASLSLGPKHPEILTPPIPPPRCCAQGSITVPPSVNAKTRQVHDYPSRAHRLSYARRTGVERGFSTLKDSASTDVRRGWCRLMGRAKNLVMLSLAVVVRNLRVLAAFERRMADAPRHIRRRKRRRSEALT